MAFRASNLLFSASNTRRCALQHLLRASKSTAAASQVVSDGESLKPFSEMPGIIRIRIVSRSTVLLLLKRGPPSNKAPPGH